MERGSPDQQPPALQSSGRAASPAIRFVRVSKVYPGVRALEGVDLEVHARKVHALVGENGAGKSTLLKILAGAHAPSSGHLEIFGERLEFHGPKDARRLGIAAVYQELTVIPAMTAVANVFLGQPRSRNGFAAEREMRARYAELCEELGVNIPAVARAGLLSVADQQALEIMRGLESDARIMVLDEPTASLAVHEREALYKIVGRLSARGVAVIFISHDLDEVLRLAQTVTVLRDGHKVATRAASDWTKAALVNAMLGRAAAVHVPRTREASDEILRATGVRVPGHLEEVDLTIRAGEIVGIAGLVGSGRTELLRALAGMDPTSSGVLVVRGKSVSWPHAPRSALRVGIALVPEDRKSQGLVLGMTVFDNINMPSFSSVASRSILRRRRELEAAEARAERVALKREVLRRPVRTLSGGNQQKVLIARWIERGIRILLVDEPTRGIDVGAKVEVFTLLDWLAAQGLGIVMVSSELEEVVAHSDRVLVLAGGRLVAEFPAERLAVSDVLRTIFKVEST
jgi:ABC-type sugar transport system ATPase subunit